MAWDSELADAKWVHSGPKGETEDISWTEFESWSRPGSANCIRFPVSPTRLAKLARVTRSCVYDWEVSPGFPARDEHGCIDANAVYWWKRDRDQARGRKLAGKGCVP